MLRTSVRPPYTAYLRVYEPLAAFPEPERSEWQGYLAAWRQAGPSGRPSALDEARRRLADLIAVPPMAVPERESREAFVHEEEGVAYLCPWRTRLRSWLALEQLAEELPAPLLDAAVPPLVRGQATADWERWRIGNPDVRPWILTSSWHVPVRWFLIFGPEDRQFVPSHWEEEAGSGGAGPEPGAPEGQDPAKRRTPPLLRYRTPMAQARRRVARGFRVLRENLDEGPLVSGVEEVGRWLEEFHPRSMVELDYGGLVHAIPEHRLAEDDSASQVAEGLAALREGDDARAGAVYRRLTERWRRVQELQSAS